MLHLSLHPDIDAAAQACREVDETTLVASLVDDAPRFEVRIDAKGPGGAGSSGRRNPIGEKPRRKPTFGKAATI